MYRTTGQARNDESRYLICLSNVSTISFSTVAGFCDKNSPTPQLFRYGTAFTTTDPVSLSFGGDGYRKMMNRKFTEADFEALDLSNCDGLLVRDFLQNVNNETLGRKVYEAINQKEKGHFDKAMLSISEANRDQVLAIREIQGILDKQDGRAKTEVVFEKFRQTLPFQIGLANGEKFLEWLFEINALFPESLSRVKIELHANEDKLSAFMEKLSFFEDRMQGRIPESEIDDLKENIAELVEEISAIKKKIVVRLNAFVAGKGRSNTPSDNLRLIKNFYLIITSSIETLDARFVEV